MATHAHGPRSTVHRGGFDAHPVLAGAAGRPLHPNRKQTEIDGEVRGAPPAPPPNLDAAPWWPGPVPA